jgi:hypothetical protein
MTKRIKLDGTVDEVLTTSTYPQSFAANARYRREVHQVVEEVELIREVPSVVYREVPVYREVSGESLYRVVPCYREVHHKVPYYRELVRSRLAVVDPTCRITYRTYDTPRRYYEYVKK